MDTILKDLVGSHVTQAFVIMVIGKALKAGAQYLDANKPIDERGKALVQIVVTGMSLVMAFLQQWTDGHLNAFDPAPWLSFITVLSSSWGMIFAADKGAEKVKMMLAGK